MKTKMRPQSFEALYDGECANCRGEIKRKQQIFYDRATRKVTCVDCGPIEQGPDEDDLLHGDDAPIRLRDVMPRGKTAADRCNSCFMIHSPGQVGCE